ncbi:MAG TPA: DNA repair protein RecO, partial [Candidatus Methanoperedens sp.]|nr:DNA repair protein RecO [Candidatus Methanoperedens sp.]
FVPQRVWPGIRADLGRTVHALAFLELLNATLTEGEHHPEVFDLLVRFLNGLEEERRPGLARIVASLRLLSSAGFAPCLAACVVCRGEVDARAASGFAPEAGGVVCRACRSQVPQGSVLPLSAATHGFLLRALTLPEGRARRLRIAAPQERDASRLLDAFVAARTGERPRCGSAIERLEAG